MGTPDLGTIPREWVEAILAAVDRLDIQPGVDVRGWPHMGAIICDAALQGGLRYKTVVYPRIARLVRTWPDATTTSRFAAHLETDNLSEALNWTWDPKLAVIRAMTTLFQQHGIERPADLSARLDDPATSLALAEELTSINGVGPKTVDYLGTLAGSSAHVAVDRHMHALAVEAGLPGLTYGNLKAAITEAALLRGWTPGSLDAGIWKHYSR